MMSSLSAMLGCKGCRNVILTFVSAASICVAMCCENASAQTQSRSTRPTVNTSRQVQASTPVTPAPDFWAASGTENGATLAEVDRLDRKKLVMVYQYIYEENYRTDFSRQNAFQTPELSGRKSLIRRFPL